MRPLADGPTPSTRSAEGRIAPSRPVFAISAVSELTGVQPQALRDYEAKGLLAPRRTAGGTRRYSADDVAHVDRIVTLLASGLNLEGVRQVLALEAETHRLRAELHRLRRTSDTGPAEAARESG